MGFYEVLSIFGIILAVCFGIMVVSAVLGALGFQAAGVLAGSCAAAWQSSIGNVMKGSKFAIMQSIGALGYLANCAVLAGIVFVGTIAAMIYYLFFYDDGIAWSWIGNSTGTIWNDSTAFFGHFSDNIQNSLQINLTSISEKVSNFTEKVSNFTEKVGEDLQPHLSSLKEKFHGLVNSSNGTK